MAKSSVHVKKDDQVIVISGKDKGAKGKVLMVDEKKGRVYVEGVNMVKKHVKPGRTNQEGGIITQEGPIHISNVMYVHKGKATRIGFHVEDGKKVRYAKSANEAID